MVQNVSHELRAPLTLLLGYLEILAAGELGPLNDAQQRSFDVLQTQTVKLQSMVERLLVLQSFEARQLHPTELDVAPWLADAAGEWNSRADGARVVMRMPQPDALPLVSADVLYLTHVIDNLLDNARKFSPANGQIEVGARCEAGEMIISVMDHGIGIPADRLERVFERFYQVDGTTTRRFGGMGIGLTLCQKIVEAHGGRIWAESGGEGCGSTFSLALPALDVDAVADLPLVTAG